MVLLFITAEQNMYSSYRDPSHVYVSKSLYQLRHPKLLCLDDRHSKTVLLSALGSLALFNRRSEMRGYKFAASSPTC